MMVSSLVQQMVMMVISIIQSENPGASCAGRRTEDNSLATFPTRNVYYEAGPVFVKLFSTDAIFVELPYVTQKEVLGSRKLIA